MSGCQNCNSGCEADICTYCDSCQGCQDCQSFCEVGGQRVGSFSFNQSLEKGEPFLTKENWNRLIKYVNDAYKKGVKSNESDSVFFLNSESDSNDFMTAEMFNKVSNALCHLGSSEGPEFRAIPDKSIVYGSYFKDLEDYANNLKYTTGQCDKCNISCNVTCLGCQACNAGCQDHSPQDCCSSCNASCEDHTAPST